MLPRKNAWRSGADAGSRARQAERAIRARGRPSVMSS